MIAAISVVLAACAYDAGKTGDTGARRAVVEPPAIARTTCAGCHAVGTEALSPNPSAPSFAAIANREGLTRETLATYLRDAHNYPDQMDVELEEAEAGALADYIVTLRDLDYRPAP